MCAPMVNFNTVVFLREHMKEIHGIEDVPDSQIGLYESYPGSSALIKEEVTDVAKSDMNVETIAKAVAEGKQTIQA